jgi:hypothetical protein
MHKRLTEQQRRGVIVAAGVRVANRDVLPHVDYVTVARECSVLTSESTVRTIFPQRADLWRAVVSHSDASGTVRLMGRELGV